MIFLGISYDIVGIMNYVNQCGCKLTFVNNQLLSHKIQVIWQIGHPVVGALKKIYVIYLACHSKPIIPDLPDLLGIK